MCCPYLTDFKLLVPYPTCTILNLSLQAARVLMSLNETRIFNLLVPYPNCTILNLSLQAARVLMSLNETRIYEGCSGSSWNLVGDGTLF